eukprot:sb/3466080/
MNLYGTPNVQLPPQTNGHPTAVSLAAAAAAAQGLTAGGPNAAGRWNPAAAAAVDQQRARLAAAAAAVYQQPLRQDAALDFLLKQQFLRQGMQTPMPQQPPTNTFHEFTTEQLLNATQGLARSEATAGAYGALGGIPGLSQLEQQHRLQQQQQQQQRVAAAAAAAAAVADPQLPLWEQHQLGGLQNVLTSPSSTTSTSLGSSWPSQTAAYDNPLGSLDNELLRQELLRQYGLLNTPAAPQQHSPNTPGLQSYNGYNTTGSLLASRLNQLKLNQLDVAAAAAAAANNPYNAAAVAAAAAQQQPSATGGGLPNGFHHEQQQQGIQHSYNQLMGQVGLKFISYCSIIPLPPVALLSLNPK